MIDNNIMNKQIKQIKNTLEYKVRDIIKDGDFGNQTIHDERVQAILTLITKEKKRLVRGLEKLFFHGVAGYNRFPYKVTCIEKDKWEAWKKLPISK